MLKKKKICTGFDGNPHEDYIYKNIDGKKYCKSCAMKLQPTKQIKKRSEKQMFKMTLKKDLLEEDKAFYIRLWNKKFDVNPPPFGSVGSLPTCQCCGQRLSLEPNFMYFHHILEKRNYPKWRHNENNIAILCAVCHNSYESNPDNVPYLKQLRELTLELYNAYELLEEQIKKEADEQKSRKR